MKDQLAEDVRSMSERSWGHVGSFDMRLQAEGSRKKIFVPVAADIESPSKRV